MKYECYTINGTCEIEADSEEDAKDQYLEFVRDNLSIDNVVADGDEVIGVEAAHHPLGFSQLEKRAKCPGSMKAETGIESEDSELSTMGNRLHESTWTGTDGLPYDESLLVDYANDRISELSLEYGIETWIGEKKMSIHHNGHFVTFGTVDGHSEIFPDTETAILLELKYGYNEVDTPDSNLQVASGSVALKQKYPQLKKVIAVIIMPRLRITAKHSFTQFDQIEKHIADIAARCYNPKAKCKAGSWCRTGYCRAIRGCKAVENMSAELMDIPIGELNCITNENADSIYEAAMTVEKQLKAIKAECKRMTISAGGQLGRLVVSEKAGNRYIPDIQAAYEKVQEYFTTEEFMAICDIKITEFEKQLCNRLKEAGEFDTIKAARFAFNDFVGVVGKKSSQVIELKKNLIEPKKK